MVNIMVVERAAPMPVAALRIVRKGASFDMKRWVSVVSKMAGTILIRQQGKLFMTAARSHNLP
jgi:hypothetical protein